MHFTVEKRDSNSLARAGILKTPHGNIKTPAFVAVATKATVKSLTPEMLTELGAQMVLGNTYHLYFEPGEGVVKAAGGLGKFMHWDGPTMTDSGGFQAFSLGAAYKKGVSKIAREMTEVRLQSDAEPALAVITEDGVTFKSHLDGSEHLFTPERSIQIQHDIGADIIFAFDECTSPHASDSYQREALARTHRWATRSLVQHRMLDNAQLLFGIVQGGRVQELREESARVIGGICPPAGGFDGFGIGGSFTKDDVHTAVGWVNTLLPEDKPRHLLGIGEPEDIVLAVEQGCDLFDCVTPTRNARNGSLYTREGKMNIGNARYRKDFFPIQQDCDCYTCNNFTKSYLAHLFRAHEMLAGTLATIHNLRFIIHLTEELRAAILDGTLSEYKNKFLTRYKK
ncbi:MAG TPA: tRNA guanosine(34) transglycosylase Tgt [Candidatus Vogelbacteria bacterium]|uniref:Queuine tRNA-ribosyltransferase n=1 Tax=Candidatus Vogelbacteria bacterium RIFOXYD1_FULL_51_18 TaxID=1802440 RepID=A0A1G2QKV1_9BACT|nr:MAG: Queuine tRNA-ribosyltransferase [Parcubacteria group bacterium GW2011_GWC1_51_35]KKW26010.1 MAG: Queuine tRNA-ribosyltransferase [Parcubacteria group bacterium GW2011_GWF2_52_12]KKW34014.1 MAG: Queuine tRNA-ribosyltransferase [Parcubacteria group bacterium GW2011_GWB1_53_43]OHA61235.1 MAG: tRNA-guanine(34) transglycosylase [Candidatus Vogelbacteria bacterium RIFOXYD1_FULL_51_18]HBB65464.1 tRNA guanosine(34) transglycosylase Tgt [Candidatus Vogelbacteria bacterium]